MPDIFAPEKRHEIMQNVKTKNTAPEIKLRSLLHKNGFRFRVNRKDLPGKPDIVLPKYRAVILCMAVFGMVMIAHVDSGRRLMPTSGVEK